jgi:hypothetical protein
MILRCSDRATSDLLARINMRAADLWRELDAVQAEIEDAGLPHNWNREPWCSLRRRESQILAELDRIDD